LVGAGKIARYLRQGFITPLENTFINPPVATNQSFHEMDDYLTPEQVNVLELKELKEYAEHLGVEFSANIQTKRLQILVNKFIYDIKKSTQENETEEDIDDDTKDDDENNDDDNGDM